MTHLRRSPPRRRHRLTRLRTQIHRLRTTHPCKSPAARVITPAYPLQILLVNEAGTDGPCAPSSDCTHRVTAAVHKTQTGKEREGGYRSIGAVEADEKKD